MQKLISYKRKVSWEKEELSDLKKLYSEGFTIPDISKKLLRTEESISKKISELSLCNRLRLWTKNEDSRLLKYYNLKLTNKEISEKLNRSSASVQARLLLTHRIKRKNVNAWKICKRENFWKSNELRVLKKLIKQGKSAKELSEAIGRSKGVIFNKMRELSLKIKPKSSEQQNLYRRLYNVDDSYFHSINSQKKAYYLGWLLTDGYIGGMIKKGGTLHNSNKIGLKIGIKDVDTLKDFKKELKAEAPIHTHNSRSLISYKNKITGRDSTIKAGIQVSFEVYSYRMKLDLAKYGVVNNKTYVATFPEKLTKEFYPGFIAGLISGDGCVYVSKRKNKKDNLRCFIAGNLELLEKIKKILIKNIKYNSLKKILKKKESINLHILELNQGETMRLYYWLKSNKTKIMERKSKIIEEFIKNFSKRNRN